MTDRGHGAMKSEVENVYEEIDAFNRSTVSSKKKNLLLGGLIVSFIITLVLLGLAIDIFVNKGVFNFGISASTCLFIFRRKCMLINKGVYFSQ